MPSCPSCQRPVAVARASCLYCGAPIAPEDVAAALSAAAQVLAQTEPAPRPPDHRGLVILDLADANPDTLADALALPPYEAGLLARRGGLQLHRVLESSEAEAEADRLRRRGVTALAVPEEEVRVRPVRATWGRAAPDALSLRSEEDGPLAIAACDLVLVVTGPIARQHQTRFARRLVNAPRLEEGVRVHLHRAKEIRPVEIDPDNFDTGLPPTGSRLAVEGWLAALFPDVPRDDSFRRLPPALAPAEPEARGPLAAASSLRARKRARSRPGQEEPVLLDNVTQFRFYSGWRGAVARRRTRTAPPAW
jgi:hypothetical protein